MGQIGFDNDKYLAMQSAHIRERISKFGGKLYLEFGGKLFDDFHASRVLPGFQPDSKIRMLQQLRDDAEIVIAVNANDIEKNKVRGDLGITYDDDCLRLIDAFRSLGLYVGGVCITQYAGQNAADAFIKRLNTLGVRNYRHYPIAGYPSDVAHIVSDEGFGRNEYIETTHSLIVVTAPGPGSGKMATCLSQLYHEHKHGVSAGYAKFETFPIWNLPLKHPVNLAYEAATADLDDVNMIDPFHLEAYGETTVNYNRDVEIFPVLRAIFERISGKCPYQSPTDMGVNMAGNCIIDDKVCRQASRMEILRRYYTAQVDVARGIADACQLRKLELVMQQADVTPDLCPAVAAAKQKAEDLLAQWKAGDATEDSFAELANENSADSGSNTNGGLYSQVHQGQMVDAFNDWCFDPARKAGDTGIVETDYGYHIMYFVGTDLPYWQVQVEDTLKNDDFNTWYTEKTADYTAEQSSFGVRFVRSMFSYS